MHKLNRDPVAPACLAGKTDPPNRWDEIFNNHDARNEIWAKLGSMQGNRCAYCESLFVGYSRHIEHFKQRRRFPEATFDWSNLFGSCQQPNSCGKYKDNYKDNDQHAYHPDELIKPDLDDPSDYLFFASDGSVSPRDQLSDEHRRKAEKTIATFNLNGPLRQEREKAIANYQNYAKELFGGVLEQLAPEEWDAEYQSVLLRIDQSPFCSAIRQFFAFKPNISNDDA